MHHIIVVICTNYTRSFVFSFTGSSCFISLYKYKSGHFLRWKNIKNWKAPSAAEKMKSFSPPTRHNNNAIIFRVEQKKTKCQKANHTNFKEIQPSSHPLFFPVRCDSLQSVLCNISPNYHHFTRRIVSFLSIFSVSLRLPLCPAGLLPEFLNGNISLWFLIPVEIDYWNYWTRHL
jgi:hypothetical protein